VVTLVGEDIVKNDPHLAEVCVTMTQATDQALEMSNLGLPKLIFYLMNRFKLKTTWKYIGID
jgi:hypothetical protein